MVSNSTDSTMPPAQDFSYLLPDDAVAALASKINAYGSGTGMEYRAAPFQGASVGAAPATSINDAMQLNYANGVLNTLLAVQGLVPIKFRSELATKISDLQYAIANKLPNIARDAAEIGLDYARDAGREGEGADETPEQKRERLWAEIKELEDDVAKKMRLAVDRGDISQETYDKWEQQYQRAQSLDEQDPKKTTLTASAAREAGTALQQAESKARSEGRTEHADGYSQSAESTEKIISRTEVLSSATRERTSPYYINAADNPTLPDKPASSLGSAPDSGSKPSPSASEKAFQFSFSSVDDNSAPLQAGTKPVTTVTR